MNTIEIELLSGHKVVGDPTLGGKDGMHLVDADGELVKGVQHIHLEKGPTTAAEVWIRFMPKPTGR